MIDEIKGENMTWLELSDRFKSLGDITGMNKIQSYDISVIFSGKSNEVEVCLYTFDCADMPRRSIVSGDSEASAKNKTLDIIKLCEKEVKESEND